MNRQSYERIRVAYYLGIFLLVINALYKVPLVEKYIMPIFNYELIKGMPLITMIAIAVGFGAFLAFRYRKIG